MKLIADTEPGSYAPRSAAGIVFHARMLGGLRVEHIGIPFEHRGRTSAVHRSTVAGRLTHAAYEVSTRKPVGRSKAFAAIPSTRHTRPRSRPSRGSTTSSGSA